MGRPEATRPGELMPQLTSNQYLNNSVSRPLPAAILTPSSNMEYAPSAFPQWQAPNGMGHLVQNGADMRLRKADSPSPPQLPTAATAEHGVLFYLGIGVVILIGAAIIVEIVR